MLIVLAIGQTLVIISGGIDLSTGWVMGLASVCASLIMRLFSTDSSLGLVVFSGFVTAILLGSFAGLINGLVISRLNVPPFIATLGMYGIARGFGYILSGGPPVSINHPGVGHFANGFMFYIHPSVGLSLFKLHEGLKNLELRNTITLVPYLIIYFGIILFVSHFVLSKTDLDSMSML